MQELLLLWMQEVKKAGTVRKNVKQFGKCKNYYFLSLDSRLDRDELNINLDIFYIAIDNQQISLIINNEKLLILLRV